MRKYNDIKNDFTFPDVVEPQYGYYAYSHGKVYGVYKSKQEANLISTNVERVYINEDAVKAYKSTINGIYKEIFNVWYAELREDHSDINDRTFDLVYEEAYDRGHSCGYDEVESYVNSYADFARSIINANRI